MISKISIYNFKSIQEASVSLRSLNILIGANGVGKSNFIGFFKLLKNIYDQNLRLFVAENGGADKLLYFGRKKSQFLEGLVYFNDKNAYHFKLNPDSQNGLIFELEESGFNTNYYPHSVGWSFENVGVGHLESKVKDTNSGRNVFLNNYFQTFKVYHFHDTSASARVKQPCQVADNRFLREDGGNLAAFLYRLQKNHVDSFKLIEATIRSIAPFFKGFDLKPLADNEQYISLEWQDLNDSDSLFNASSLSDGTLRMMCLTALLLQPDLPQTIIIDEPELGLHPFAINKLAGLLSMASQKSQIIISTQSMNLIDNFVPEDIIVVDRKDKQTTFRNLDADELSTWLEEYSLGEIWEKNLIGGRPA